MRREGIHDESDLLAIGGGDGRLDNDQNEAGGEARERER